jgi:phthalate 4,5-cis-dihydrodiol dehydrogenase
MRASDEVGRCGVTKGRTTLGIGIIGAGHFAARHAGALAEAGDMRVAAACRRDAAALAAFVAAHGGRGYRDVEALLADPDVDAVVIASPHHLHEAHACAAARAGKPMLLEKPMAPDLAACDRIAAAARAARVGLMLGHTLRFAAPVVAARRLIAGGEIGEVRYGRAAMIRIWMQANRRDWHMDRARGGGMLLTAGIHALDALLWLMPAPPRRVHAVLATRFHDMDADDVAQLAIRFADGAIGSVASIGYRDGAPLGAIEIAGTRGVLALDPAKGLRLGRGGAWTDIALAPAANVVGDALVEEWRAFGRMVRDGAPPAVDGAAGRAAIAVIAAACESSARGVEIDVDAGVRA